MAYAITVDRVPTGPDFEQTLRDILSHDHADRRAAEQDSLRHVIFVGAAALGKVRPDILARLNERVGRARETAKAYEAAERAANLAEELTKHPSPAIAAAAASEFVTAEIARAEALSVAKAAESLADEAQAEAEKGVPPSWTAHVPEMYDRQIEASVKAAAALVAGGALGDGVGAAKIQIAGHVEQDGKGFASVHVWPAV